MVTFATGLRSGYGLVALLLGTFMGMLDIFIVNIAAPSIQRDLGASFGELQLVIAAYDLTYAAGLVAGGRLGDRFGPRRVFQVGTVTFALTSAACAAAPNVEMLIGGRILQGLSAAVMLPQVLALVQVIYEGRQRERAIGAYSAVIGLAAIVGQVVGGLLLHLDILGLGWRAIFVVNVPLAIAAIVGTAVAVPDPATRSRVRLDLHGAAILAIALFALLYPLSRAEWSHLDVGLLVSSPVLLVVFWRWEHRLARAGTAPLLPPRLFSQPGFARGFPTALCFYGGNAAFVFVVQYQLQVGLGWQPLEAVLVFAPMALASAAGSLMAGALVARFGHRVTISGAVVTAVGVVLTRYGIDATEQLIIGVIVYGIGGGLVVPSIVGLALGGVRTSDAGAASGALLTVTQAANALGITGVGAVFGTLRGAEQVAAFDTTLLLLACVFGVAVVLLRLLVGGAGRALPR